MKEKLEKLSLHTIVIAEKDVTWVKTKKEIWYEGRMFDIKKTSLKGGQYTFTGLFDEEETALNHYLDNEINKRNKSGNSLLAQLFQWLQSAINKDSSDSLNPPPPIQTICSYLPQFTPFPVKNILTPPPRA